MVVLENYPEQINIFETSSEHHFDESFAVPAVEGESKGGIAEGK